MWPSSWTFHSNWPLLADDLVVAAWKLDGAAAADLPLVEEADHELLDPPEVPERGWPEIFAAELASHPLILQDLGSGRQGDGVERVLERAGLTMSERLVIRSFIAGDETRTTAADLGWRPQTVTLLLACALRRLADVEAWATPPAARQPATSGIRDSPGEGLPVALAKGLKDDPEALFARAGLRRPQLAAMRFWIQGRRAVDAARELQLTPAAYCGRVDRALERCRAVAV